VAKNHPVEDDYAQGHGIKSLWRHIHR